MLWLISCFDWRGEFWSSNVNPMWLECCTNKKRKRDSVCSNFNRCCDIDKVEIGLPLWSVKYKLVLRYLFGFLSDCGFVVIPL